MGNVSSDGITQSTKLAGNATKKQNSNLNTVQGVKIASREVGAPWHSKQLGVGQIMGLRGFNLENTSHKNVSMESFATKPHIESTEVANVHSAPTQQVLPRGPIDGGDFSGLRSQISSYSAGRNKNSSLASWDIRDIRANRKNLNEWARHGGVDPSGSSKMELPTPPYFDKVKNEKLQLSQQYPHKINTNDAQGFFD